MNQKYKVLFKDTFVFALGSLGSKVILFFLVPLYTNFLSKAEYGIADLVFTTSQLIIPLVSVVIFEAVIRFGLMKDKNPAEVLKAGIIIGGLGTLLTVAITPVFSFYTPIAEWKWYLCIYVILNFNNNIIKSYLKVKNKNKQFAIISIVQTLALATSNVLLLTVFNIGIRGYLLSNIFATGISLLISTFAGKVIIDIKNAKTNWKLLKEMLIYSSPLILNDLSWWVIHSSDKYMVEVMIDESALGLFTAATKIPALINVLISIFGQAWNISSIKEMDSSNDTSFYSKVFEGYTFMAFCSCVFLVTIIKPFMSIYVGKEFNDAWMYVPLLLVSAVFAAVSSYFGQLYAALKKSVNNMLTTLTAAIINIIVNYFFILLVGVWGAVIGTVVSYIVVAFVRMIDIRRFVNIKINFIKFLLNCLIILSQGIIVSLNIHILLFSIISIVLFIFINYKTIVSVINAIKGKMVKN